MDPSCSSKDRGDHKEPQAGTSKNNNILKTEIIANNVNNSDAASINHEQIDELEHEDMEEESRLIKSCNKLLLYAEKLAAVRYANARGSPSEEQEKENLLNLPSCSTSKECDKECDSNTTIRNMLQSRVIRPSYYDNRDEAACSNSDWRCKKSRIKCEHRSQEKEETVSTAEKASQASKYIANEKRHDSQVTETPTVGNSAPSTSKYGHEECKDDASVATRNFLQEYYGDDDSDDEESEEECCNCEPSFIPEDCLDEQETSTSDNDETTRFWRKRSYDSGSSSSSSTKRICKEVTARYTPTDATKLFSLHATKLLAGNNAQPGPPELQSWLQRFNSWSNSERIKAIDALICRSDFAQIRHMMTAIEPLFRRDFITLLPKELALTVLANLEPDDLINASQTCRYWRFLANDNLLWREQCRRIGITHLKRKPRRTPFSASPWKAAFLRYQKVESNWVTRSVDEPTIMKAHDDHVITCLQFFGNRILSGSDDTTLKVWSAVTGRCLRTLVGHTGGVWSSQMYGRLVISGSTDRTLRVWNAKTGKCLKVLTGHTSTVRCMHLYRDKVVSGSRDSTLRVWAIPEGKCLQILVGHLAAVRCVQYNGKVVVSGAYDYFVKIWNPITGECLHTLAGHTNRVYSLQFDGVHVVSGSLDTSIRVWDAKSGQLRHTLVGHQSLTSGMELHSNILVSGNADSTVKVWDITSGRCLHTLSSGPHKHQSAVTCLQSTRRFVMTSSDDGTVKLWDVATGAFIRNLVELGSGGSGGVVWRIRASAAKLVCAVGSRNGTEETKLLVLDFDKPLPCHRCAQ